MIPADWKLTGQVDWPMHKGNPKLAFHVDSPDGLVGLEYLGSESWSWSEDAATRASLKAKGETLTESQGLPLADYATHGGSFPLAVEGAGVVGSVTVSGLPQRSDHELVVEALCAALGRDYAELRLAAE